MNAERRKSIQKIIGTLQEIQPELEQLAGDERDAFDNLSENLQNGERGQAMDNAANCLETARDSMDEIISQLEESAQ